MELILVSLASFWAWETVRSLLPFGIHARFAPVCVLLVAFGLLHLPHVVVLAMACAAVVAFLRILARGPGPWSPSGALSDLREIAWPRPRMSRHTMPGAQGNPPSHLGNRLPRL